MSAFRIYTASAWQGQVVDLPGGATVLSVQQHSEPEGHWYSIIYGVPEQPSYGSRLYSAYEYERGLGY